jgi:D-serine dehydratase
MDLSELFDRPVECTEKGLPYGPPVTAAAVRDRNWNLLRGDLPFPALALRESALAHNIAEMANWCAQNRFEIAPHGKTTMCPRIYHRQMDAGAWGITVATTSQALVCLRFGIRRVLIANQLVGAANIRSLAEAMNQHAEAELYCLADSVEGVDHLAQWLEQSALRRPLGALIEFGRAGWRTGVRPVDQAAQVREAISRHGRYLRFCGVEAFEGLAASEEQAEEFLEFVVSSARSLAPETDSRPLMFSAGGSGYLSAVSRALSRLSGDWRPLIRSGCYVTHDHGFYAERQRNRAAPPEFRAALELWSYVQSAPDPNVAILNFGKRDCAYDLSLPLPLDLPGATITALNDQHAFLAYPGKLAVGTKIRCGISHPCTAFDKWRVIPVVDDEYNVIDLYETFF